MYKAHVCPQCNPNKTTATEIQYYFVNGNLFSIFLSFTKIFANKQSTIPEAYNKIEERSFSFIGPLYLEHSFVAEYNCI